MAENHDDLHKRHFDYTDYYRYIVNENPDEPQYSRHYPGRSEGSHSGQGERHAGFSGKGPKNYHRSSERIMEDINDRLTNDPRLDASHIEVQLSNDDIILSGFAPDRTSKRRACDIAESVPGVKNVENRIRVSKQ